MNNDAQKQMVDMFMRMVPHHRHLGIGYHGHGRGWASLELPYVPHLVSDTETGIIASGAIFSLMDSTGGMAVFTALDRFDPHATLDLRLDYLRPATPGLSVISRAEVTKMTRSVAFVRGIAHDGDPARPVAHMTGTFMFTAGAKA